MNSAHEWFKEAKYGMMVHWGLYSLLGGEYKGQKVRSYAEWAQSYFRIPNAEYELLAKAFNPVYFSAEEWVRFAVECGMKYLVVTSKHHDGFALFRSRVDKYNLADATPFGRDVMAELAEACYKHGLKLGLYYSQDLDWHEPNGGGYLSNQWKNAGTTWDNSWDFPDEEKKDFSVCFENKIMPQIEEILTGYGELCLIWFDVPFTISNDQSRRIYEAVKKYQPNCLVNSRLGNGAYDYVSLGDNEIPDSIEDVAGRTADMNSIGGLKPSVYGLYETAATLNDTWGFSYHDHNWKSVDKIYSIKRKLNGMGINYLINVGPDPLGRITTDAQRILRGVAERL
ncbi:MAG: alpha-L-fucosidase [Clostridiales bacterium]|nr:alpha-L-fucosidase [Clostridiales bacterium]